MSYLGTNRGRARLSLDSVSGTLIAPPTSGLIAHWAMINSGTTIYDESGNGNNGTAVGAPTFGVSYGVRGNGINLVAANSQYIEVPTSASVSGLEAASLSVWFYYGSDPASDQFLYFESISAAATSARFTLILLQDNTLRIAGRGDDTDAAFVATSSALTSGNWYHAVMVWDSSSDVFSLHLNAVLAAENTASKNAFQLTTPDNIKIGCIGNISSFHNGFIDEVRLYNRALTIREIQILFNYDRAGAGL
jgi:hypothetical protein